MSQAIPDTGKIKGIVKKYIRQTLANDEQLRSGLDVDSDLDILTGSDMGLAEVESMQNLVTRWLRQNDHSIVLKSPYMVKNYLSEAKDEDEQKTLARELLKAFQSVLTVRRKRSQGDYTQSDDELVPILAEGNIVQAVLLQMEMEKSSVQVNE